MNNNTIYDTGKWARFGYYLSMGLLLSLGAIGWVGNLLG